MGNEIKHMMNEADIGSGEKSTGQKEVDRDVNSINGRKGDKPVDGSQFQQVTEEQEYAEERHPDQQPGHVDTTSRILRSGNHLARISTEQLPDGTYEAQVFVRLTREPETAETYIPAGAFVMEGEAWAAAERRANRALKEREF
jgi:hypothetical protein